MNPTQEQQDIIEVVTKEPKIAVIAVPGSGKTTLLKMIANEYGSSKILGLAFNSSIAKENSKKFPSNTTFKTVHSMAYRWYRNKHKNKKELTNLKPIMVKDILGLKQNTKYNILVAIMKAFDEFCLSDSVDIEIRGDEPWLKEAYESIGYQPKLKPFIVDGANKLLSMMRGDLDIINHNFYLKEFHLWLHRNSSSYTRYDIVMLDEAQDATAITKAIFSSLNASRKIMVGDPDQQLYSFIGAINALRTVKEDGYKTYPLTNSFRMPPDVADRCNNIIQMIKGYDPQVKGLAPASDDQIKDTAFIFRTNGQMIRWMVRAIDREFWDWTTIRNPKDIFSTAIDISMMNKWVNEDQDHFTIKPKDFNNRHLWFVFRDYNEEARGVKSLYGWLIDTFQNQDREIETTVKLLGELGSNSISIFDLYNSARNQFNEASTKEFRVKLTTAHISKGLEFDRVVLGTDFYKPNDLVIDEVGLPDDSKVNTLLFKLFNEELEKNTELLQRLGNSKDKWIDYMNRVIEARVGLDKFQSIIQKHVLDEYHTRVKNQKIKDWGKIDEINLVYVASSRAKKILSVPSDMDIWFNERILLSNLSNNVVNEWVGLAMIEFGMD